MLTSVNLSPIPFQSSTDSTRLQMSSKQIQQSLTSPNCEIPYIVGNNFEKLTDTSMLGIYKAKDRGRVLFSNEELIIVYYENLDKPEVKYRPPIKKASANFASKLRFTLQKDDIFDSGDIIYEYDCFRNGMISSGYNIFTAYMPWFGYNHEDGIVISESFANKAEANLIDKIYIPIHEFTLFWPMYSDIENSFDYFPGIGQELNNDILCAHLIPKKLKQDSNNIKFDLINILKNMNLSELLSMNNNNIMSAFNVKYEKSKLTKGHISGIKIHKLSDKKLIDLNLQKQIDRLYYYYHTYLIDTYTELSEQFNSDFCSEVMYRHFIYNDKNLERGKLDLRDVVYLIEFEISQTEKSHLGDKFTNMYAGKGVVSQILPNELRPIAEYSNKPIDMIFNPFGVFSRMNYGQIINGMISKSVQYYDDQIKKDDQNVKQYITELNNIIKFLDINYHNDIQKYVINNLDDPNFRERFVSNIKDNNLYIRAKAFLKLDIKNLVSNLRRANETVIIKKETLQYLKDKLNIKLGLTINGDIKCHNIFCAPIYTMKLYKITSKSINARDFGPVESLTGQPTKGRAKEGGSKLGQMEINFSLLCIVIYI